MRRMRVTVLVLACVVVCLMSTAESARSWWRRRKSCDPGQYRTGKRCQPCPDNCQTCEKRQGMLQCLECRAGFHGFLCKEACPLQCNFTCNLYGECDSCQPGFYGLHCQEKCPPTCEGSCYKGLGECQRCKEGYTGAHCETPCATMDPLPPECVHSGDNGGKQGNESTASDDGTTASGWQKDLPAAPAASRRGISVGLSCLALLLLMAALLVCIAYRHRIRKKPLSSAPSSWKSSVRSVVVRIRQHSKVTIFIRNKTGHYEVTETSQDLNKYSSQEDNILNADKPVHYSYVDNDPATAYACVSSQAGLKAAKKTYMDMNLSRSCLTGKAPLTGNEDYEYIPYTYSHYSNLQDEASCLQYDCLLENKAIYVNEQPCSKDGEQPDLVQATAETEEQYEICRSPADVLQNLNTGDYMPFEPGVRVEHVYMNSTAAPSMVI